MTIPLVRRGFLGRLAGLFAVGGVPLASGAFVEAPPPQQSRQPRPAGGFSVKDFGAAGNDAGNDTKAIQDAIDHAERTGGNVVHVPAGAYRIAAPAEHPAYALRLGEAVTIVGDGIGRSLLRHTGSSDGVRVFKSDGSQIVSSSLRDLTIAGDGRQSRIGLVLALAPYGFYQNVNVNGFEGGVSVDQSWNSVFEQVTATGCRGDGWSIGLDANNVGLRNCQSMNNGRAGFAIAGARGLMLMDCDAEGNETGVVIEARRNRSTEKVSLVGGYYEGNRSEEIAIRSDGTGARAKAITLRDVYFVHIGASPAGGAIGVRVSAVNHLLVSGCHFSAAGEGYRHSLYLAPGGTVAGVVWDAGNMDESTNGRFKGRGTAYAVVGVSPG